MPTVLPALLGRGRIGRRDYLLLGALAMGALVLCRLVLTGPMLRPGASGLEQLLTATLPTLICATLNLNLIAARLHDTGQGRRLLPLVLAPGTVLLAGLLVSTLPPAQMDLTTRQLGFAVPRGVAQVYIGYMAMIWIFLSALPSDPAANAHGPPTASLPVEPAGDGRRTPGSGWADVALRAVEQSTAAARSATPPRPGAPLADLGAGTRQAFGRRRPRS